MNAPAINPQVLRLAALLELERRARAASGPGLTYLIVNDTATVVPYQQAALWRDGKLAAVSGVAAPEEGGPYARWLNGTLATVATKARSPQDDPSAPVQVDPAMLGRSAGEWQNWFPPAALWVPLPDPRGGLAGGLLLGRQDPWHAGELQLLSALAGTYGLVLATGELRRRRAPKPVRRHALRTVAVLTLLALAFTPIRASVLAPAAIVAGEPYPVRAPFDGVVDAIHVTPNTSVHKGDALLSLDTTERRAKTEVAGKALEMARAELSEASQQAMTDQRAKGRLAMLQAKVAQAQLEYDYDRTMLGRAEVVAPIDGVAVFEDAHEWIGRPVTLGERIMTVAPPTSADLDIAVPIADVVTFASGSEVVFFPNVSPDRPAHGRLLVAGYGAAPTPEGVMAYTFRAHLDDADGPLRLGLKGTAKIYGPHRPFVLWVLRRPLAVLREWLSL